ncbi:DUF6415 family natural product biosynthesis protein [Streptomyces sp. NPDC048197]|uniref:DUF6415 family natural product biosynthesis protein n=1 Tax=Streptomyces sp. NPDC048197 TaxID=3365511 RepID=UPI00371CAEB1
MSQQSPFMINLDTMRWTVAESLRERNCDGHPRRTVTTLGRLLARLRVHAAVLLPIIEGRLRKMSPDDPRRGEVTLEVKRGRGAQGTRLTNDFPRDVANLRYLARLVANLIEIVEEGRQQRSVEHPSPAPHNDQEDKLPTVQQPLAALSGEATR